MYPTLRNDGRCFCCKTRNNGNSFFLFPSFLAWLLLSTCAQWEFLLIYCSFLFYICFTIICPYFKSSKRSMYIQVCSGISRDLKGCPEMTRDNRKHPGESRDVQRLPGMSRDYCGFLEYKKMFIDVPICLWVSMNVW